MDTRRYAKFKEHLLIKVFPFWQHLVVAKSTTYGKQFPRIFGSNGLYNMCWPFSAAFLLMWELCLVLRSYYTPQGRGGGEVEGISPFQTSRKDLGSSQPPFQRVAGFFPQRWSNRDVKMSSDLRQIPRRLRMTGVGFHGVDRDSVTWWQRRNICVWR